MQVGDPVRVADDHRVDRRALQLVGDARGSGRPTALPGVLPIGLLPVAVPSWMTTICTLTPSARSRCDSAAIRGPSSRNVKPGRGAGRDQLGRLLEPGADHADLDAVDLEHLRRRDPVGRLAGGRLDDVGCQEREVGPRLLLEQPRDAVVELVVAVGRRVQAPGVLDVDRRHVLAAGRSSAAMRRRCRHRPGSARARQGRQLLVEHRGEVRRAADRAR